MIFRFSQHTKGFSLIELMVSISIFSIIMTITMGSILSVFTANRKSEAVRSVLDNLSYVVDGMTRTIRFGSTYHCNELSGDITTPLDCPSGGTSLVLLTSDGSRVIYRLNGTHIEETVPFGFEGCSTFAGCTFSLTSSDTTIQKLTFRVFGSYPYSGSGTTDKLEPQVIVVVSGYAGTTNNAKSSFTLETTLSQRKFDYQ